jgi:hypothetical protein
MTSTKCSECGAAARTEEDRFCAYCGARFPEPAAPPVVSAADGRQARLEVLLGRPEVRAELGRQVSTAPLATRQGLGLIPLGFAVAAAGFIASTASSAGAPGLFSLVPAVMVIVLVVKALGRGAKTVELASSPSKAQVAEIRDVQTETTGHGEHLSSVRRVIFEDEGGSRSNLEVPDKLARRLAPGDTGVAHHAGGHLLAFKRFEV